MFNSLKKLFKRKSASNVSTNKRIENLIGELVKIHCFSVDGYPAVMQFDMEYNDGDKQQFKFHLKRSDAEWIRNRLMYLLQDANIPGIDWDGDDADFKDG